MSKIVRRDFVKLITCEYLNQNTQKQLSCFREKIAKQKSNLISIYGQQIKNKLDDIFNLMYEQVLFELEDIVKFTLSYSLDVKKIINQ